jgi:pyruvate,orthophosphate dikinase
MHAAEGILTARGGMTSHAAVVARGWGKCCVAGCSDITIDEKAGEFRTVGGQKVKRGDWISLDGSSGTSAGLRSPTVAPNPLENQHYIKWCDREFRTMGVRTNADTPADASARASSAPRASASAAPSTCSSRATASTPCAR